MLRFEGGYVDDPSRPGGAANKGIALQVFRAFGRQLLGMEPTPDNLRRFTDDAQAGILYKTLYLIFERPAELHNRASPSRMA